MTVAAAALPPYEHYEQGKQLATLDGDLGSVVAGRGASLVAVQDAGNFFPGITNGVEGVLQQLGLTQATPSFGPTGTAPAQGGAIVDTAKVKSVTAVADATPTTVLNVTIPNAANSAIIDLDMLAVLGAGGAIGANEAVKGVKYQLVLTRTAGVATVGTLSAAINTQEAHVAGATTIATATLALAAVTGGVGATQTLPIQATISKTGGASANHVAILRAEIINMNAGGITIA
jgi:hypothetical protein